MKRIRKLHILTAVAAACFIQASAQATELDAIKPGKVTIAEVRAQFGEPVAKGAGAEVFERYEARDKGYRRVSAWYDEGRVLKFAKVELAKKLSPQEAAALFTLGDTLKSVGGNAFTGEAEGRTESYAANGVHFWIADDVAREIWITPANTDIMAIAEVVRKTRVSEVTPEAAQARTPEGAARAAAKQGEAPELPAAWLGVYVVEVGGKSAKSTGVRITEVEKGSPAEAAGLKEGDVLFVFDGKTIKSADMLVSSMAGKKPYEQVEIEYIRGGSRSSVLVQLGTRWRGGEKAAVEPKKLGDIGVVLSQVSTEVAKAKGLVATEGALITETIRGREAEKAGLKAGDVITGFAGTKVTRIEELRKLLSSTAPGTIVQIEIWRDGKAGLTEVVVGELR
jgi:membrane-associated protease RseP (regulator of RpoE activity)